MLLLLPSSVDGFVITSPTTTSTTAIEIAARTRSSRSSSSIETSFCSSSSRWSSIVCLFWQWEQRRRRRRRQRSIHQQHQKHQHQQSLSLLLFETKKICYGQSITSCQQKKLKKQKQSTHIQNHNNLQVVKKWYIAIMLLALFMLLPRYDHRNRRMPSIPMKYNLRIKSTVSDGHLDQVEALQEGKLTPEDVGEVATGPIGSTSPYQQKKKKKTPPKPKPKNKHWIMVMLMMMMKSTIVYYLKVSVR